MALASLAAWIDATFAAIDAPTASVIVAIVGAVATLALKLVPKTRPEAARDRATARLEDAQAWDTLVENLREVNQELRTEVSSLKAQKIAAEAKLIVAAQDMDGLRADFAALKRLMQPE